MNVHMLSDSASDLSSGWYEKLDVEVVPVHLNIDVQTITLREMYNAMGVGKRLTTSQTNPQAFKSVFTRSANIMKRMKKI